MTVEREAAIRQRLLQQFSPTSIVVKDQSHLHAGHEGAKDGKGHFDVTIVSAAFEGHNRIQRHRMVYDALADLMATDIHALRIRALDPTEPH